MEILNIVKLSLGTILLILIVAIILICGKLLFENCKSKNYRVTRLLNCIFIKEDYKKYLDEIELCLENNLIVENNKEKNGIYKLTDRGFDYMNSHNSLHESLFALIISVFSLCATIFSFLMSFILN